MLLYQKILQFLRVPAVLLVLSVTSLSFADANANTSHTELKQKALDANLHQSDYWHALVHYYPTRLYPLRNSKGEFESHVDDARFFLAENGKHDPQAELLATIDALFNEQAPNLPDAALCKFVARNKWLRKELSLPTLQVPDECVDYHTYRGNIGAGSMTLVFPASYLNSPSSMFGHTLLRFDPEDMTDNSPLLSWALNFAADVGDEAMSAGFAFKGISGGYPGKFSSVPYFEKLKEYGAIENRDIWEYKLDLTPEEIDRVLDHSFELQDMLFDYFFFRQNCSFRLLELIDVGRPGLNLADQFPYTAIPADTVKAVSNAGIIAEVNYRASQGTQLNHSISTIPRKNRHWIEKVQAKPSVTQAEAFKKLTPDVQARIIKTANELLTFRSRKSQQAQETAKRRLELLRLISQLDNDNDALDVPLPDSPAEGHDTTTVALTRGRTSSTNYTEAALRVSYHDVLDREKGYARGAGIELGTLRIRRIDDGSTRFEGFDLVHLQSFNDSFSQINGLSWEIIGGLNRNPFIEDDRLSARFDGSVGKSLRVGKNDIAYGLIGASANLFLGPGKTFANAHIRLGIIGYRQYGGSQIELRFDSIQRQSLLTSLSFTQNIPLAKNHALRLNIKTHRFNSESSEDYSLSYRYHF